MDYIEYSSLKQLWGETTRGDTFLNSLFVNKQEMFWDVMVKNSFDDNGSEMMEFVIPREMRNSSSRIMILDFSNLTGLLGKLPLVNALKEKLIFGPLICLEGQFPQNAVLSNMQELKQM